MLLSSQLNNIISQSLILAAIFLMSTSCSNKLESNNRAFLDRYGSQVSRINRDRSRAVSSHVARVRNPNLNNDVGWKNPAQIIGNDGTFSVRSAFLDTSLIKRKEKSGEFLPNIITLMEGKRMQDMSPDIFDIAYKLENYPSSYKKAVVSFEDIKIPEHDYFGIKSNLGKKPYNIIDHKILQTNIDYVNDYLGKDNREINLQLLREKEELRNYKIRMLLESNIMEEEVAENLDIDEIGEEQDNGNEQANAKTPPQALQALPIPF